MRCPSCNKFVSFEEMDPVVELIEIDEPDDTGHADVNISVTITNACAECGEELTTAELCLEDVVFIQEHRGDNHTLTVEEESSERITRQEGKGRGRRIYYGAEVSYQIRCLCGDPLKGTKPWTLHRTISDDIQASLMDALV